MVFRVFGVGQQAVLLHLTPVWAALQSSAIEGEGLESESGSIKASSAGAAGGGRACGQARGTVE